MTALYIIMLLPMLLAGLWLNDVVRRAVAGRVVLPTLPEMLAELARWLWSVIRRLPNGRRDV